MSKPGEICVKYLIMQTISLTNVRNERKTFETGFSIAQKVKNILDISEANRFGIIASLILMQVTIAGFNVVIPPMVGISIWIMMPGIVLVFIANGVALAQMSMKWVLPAFVLSMLVNATISIYSIILFYNF